MELLDEGRMLSGEKSKLLTLRLREKAVERGKGKKMVSLSLLSLPSVSQRIDFSMSVIKEVSEG